MVGGAVKLQFSILSHPVNITDCSSRCLKQKQLVTKLLQKKEDINNVNFYGLHTFFFFFNIAHRNKLSITCESLLTPTRLGHTNALHLIQAVSDLWVAHQKQQGARRAGSTFTRIFIFHNVQSRPLIFPLQQHSYGIVS